MSNLPAVLLSLRGLAEREQEAKAFYQEWLTALCSSTSALAGRCWLADAKEDWQTFDAEEDWRPVAAAGQAEGIPELPAERLEELRRDRMAILARSAPTTAGPSTAGQASDEAGCTEVWAPWLVAGEFRGAVVVVFAITNPQAQQGCLRFVVEACESVERFHLLDDRRTAVSKAKAATQEQELDALIRRYIERQSVVSNIANYGQWFLKCDRLTVLVNHGRTFRVAAVSGATEVLERSGAVRALVDIAKRSAPLERTIVFPRPEDLTDWTRELDVVPEHGPDDKLTAALQRYVDQHFAKRLIFVPLIVYGHKDERGEVHRPYAYTPIPLGALIIETFGNDPPPADEPRKIAALARSATAALRTARQYESLWLLPLWRVLGNIWQFLFGPGKLLRTALIVALIGAAVTAAIFTEADDTAYCRGRLRPVAERRVFAPLDGIVREPLVKHGDTVRAGQPLVKLENTDLQIARADLQGKLTSAEQQKLAAEQTQLRTGAQSSPTDETRLAGEIDRLKKEIESLKNQIEMIDKKLAELVITSPIAGEITTWNADELLRGRPVRQGQQLLTVAAVAGDWELELSLPDDRSGRVVDAARTAAAVEQPLRVTYSPALDPGTVREARVVEIQNSADLREDEGNVVLVRAAIKKEDLPQRRPGAEVAAHVHCGRRSTAYVWTRDLVDFVRSRILFRWF